jgi:hypothetical protein
MWNKASLPILRHYFRSCLMTLKKTMKNFNYDIQTLSQDSNLEHAYYEAEEASGKCFI